MRRMLVAAVVFALACGTLVQANLLLNPSFETAGAGGSWDPANWSRSDGNDRTDISSWGSDWTPPDGSWVMKVNNNGTPPNDHNLGQPGISASVYLDDLVKFQFYTHVNDNTTFTNASVNIGLLDTINGDAWYNIEFTSDLQAQTWGDHWVQYTFVVTNTDKANVTGISPWIDIQGWNDPGTSGDLLFDSANLEVIPEPMSAALFSIAAVGFLVWRRNRR